MGDPDVLEQIASELRGLREAVERVEKHLSRSGRTTRKGKRVGITNVSDEELKNRYREFVDEYKHHRTTRKLDEFLAQSRSSLTRFAAVNNLPVNLKAGKAGIREQILARVREDEQLVATYRMGA